MLGVECGGARMRRRVFGHAGIKKRGTIEKGALADLVLFDPATVIDNSTPKDPHLVSTGIVGVWVNGKRVWENGKPTGAHPRRVLRR